MAGGERATALPKLCYGGRRYDGAFPLISVTASEEGKKRDTEKKRKIEDNNKAPAMIIHSILKIHLSNCPPTPTPPLPPSLL